eukprot:COSAG02_NODE_26048_length_642_cov_1.088398_1_plen_41_part_01
METNPTRQKSLFAIVVNDGKVVGVAAGVTEWGAPGPYTIPF